MAQDGTGDEKGRKMAREPGSTSHMLAWKSEKLKDSTFIPDLPQAFKGVSVRLEDQIMFYLPLCVLAPISAKTWTIPALGDLSQSPLPNSWLSQIPCSQGWSCDPNVWSTFLGNHLHLDHGRGTQEARLMRRAPLFSALEHEC